MERLRAILVLASCLACLFGCADSRESLARQHLEAQIASQASGALTLVSFTKTNGYDHEREGVKLYTLEWEAHLQAQTDGWKAGWATFSLSTSRPNALEAAVMGVSTHRVLKGATAVILGKSTLQKADRGWRVLDATVTASKILPAPDVPSEGRSTDIQTFFPAFKQALASRNTQAVAKFVEFPLSFGPYSLNEAEFHAQFPLSADTIGVITKVEAPTKRVDDSYGVGTGHSAIEFKRNRDGYWKWILIEDWSEGVPADATAPPPPG